MKKNHQLPSLDEQRLQSAAEHMDAMRAILVDRLWTGVFVLALLGAPASLMRIATTGWQPTYWVHISTAAIISYMYLFCKKAPHSVKAYTIMAILVAVAVIGLVNFGLASQSGGIFIVFMILSGLLFAKRTALIMSTGFAVVMLLIGAGFITERLQLSFDANAYMHSLSGWTFLFLGATLFGAFVAIAVLVQREFINKLLVEKEIQQQRIVHQSNHDTLTGLPTLRLAMDRLNIAIQATRRNSHQVALMFVDLDQFKKVNDTHGHTAGDHVLQQVAERLSAAVRPSDTVARVGGDEFLVILDRQTDRNHAAGTAKRIIKALTQPFEYQDHVLHLSCSIGISFAPGDADDPDALKAAADAAMYKVKAAGKNNFAFATQSR